MIIYKDIPHTYETVEGDKYTSATTLLGKYEPIKDWVKIRTNYAKKYNREQKKLTGVNPNTDAAYWEAEWKKAGDIACAKGTKYHLEQELKTLTNTEMVIENQTIPIVPSVLDEKEEKESLSTLVLEEGVYPELIVWNDKYKIAGQADKVIIVNDTIHILDYKTNKKLDFNAFVRFDGSYDTFQEPIDHIEYCKANLYYLQLNLYAYLIKLHNPHFRIGSLIIRHVQFDEDDNVLGHKDYEAPLMQKDIKKILKHSLEQ